MKNINKRLQNHNQHGYLDENFKKINKTNNLLLHTDKIFEEEFTLNNREVKKPNYENKLHQKSSIRDSFDVNNKAYKSDNNQKNSIISENLKIDRKSYLDFCKNNKNNSEINRNNFQGMSNCGNNNLEIDVNKRDISNSSILYNKFPMNNDEREIVSRKNHSIPKNNIFEKNNFSYYKDDEYYEKNYNASNHSKKLSLIEFEKKEDLLLTSSNVDETKLNNKFCYKNLMKPYVNTVSILNSERKYINQNSKKNSYNLREEYTTSHRFKISQTSTAAITKEKSEFCNDSNYLKNSKTKDVNEVHNYNTFNKLATRVNKKKFITREKTNQTLNLEINTNFGRCINLKKKNFTNFKHNKNNSMTNIVKDKYFQTSNNSSNKSYFMNSKNSNIDIPQNKFNKIKEKTEEENINKDETTNLYKLRNKSKHSLNDMYNHTGNKSMPKNKLNNIKLDQIILERNQIYTNNEIHQLNNFMGIMSKKQKIEVGSRNVDFYYFYKLTNPITYIEYNETQKYKFIHTFNFDNKKNLLKISNVVKFSFLFKVFKNQIKDEMSKIFNHENKNLVNSNDHNLIHPKKQDIKEAAENGMNYNKASAKNSRFENMEKDDFTNKRIQTSSYVIQGKVKNNSHFDDYEMSRDLNYNDDSSTKIPQFKSMQAKIFNWLEALNLIKEGSISSEELPRVCANGVFFSDLINRLEGVFN